MSPICTVLTVTDLTSASYQLVGLAASIAKPCQGEVILVSTYGGGGASRRSHPPPGASINEKQWRQQMEARLRREGQLLERQRQWCADQGVRCRAELYEEGAWPELVLQSATRSHVDLILVSTELTSSPYQVGPEDVRRLARAAPCTLSLVGLPGVSAF